MEMEYEIEEVNFEEIAEIIAGKESREGTKEDGSGRKPCSNKNSSKSKIESVTGGKRNAS